jgi:hypothetical protein
MERGTWNEEHGTRNMEVGYECWIKLYILHYSLQIGTSHQALNVFLCGKKLF